MRLAVALLLVISGPWLGCGYHLVRYGVPVAGVSSVALQTLRNDSSEPGLEFIVTDALAREFLRRGSVRVVDDPEQADLVISGRVLPLSTSGQSFSSVVLALEYQVTLRLVLEASARDGRKVTIDRAALSESELYLASADVEALRKNREEALRRIAGVLAVRVHESLIEGVAP